MRCQNCSSELKPNAVFCPNCGTRVVNTGSLIVNSDIITIGRAADNVIHIESTGVSSYHAKMYVNGNKVFIEDLNSTNGTFINNQKIKVSPIELDTDIYLGQNYKLNLKSVPSIKSLFEYCSNSNGSISAKKTSIESTYDAPVMNIHSDPFRTPYENKSNQSPSMQQQVNINIQHQSKSVGISLLLTFLFGPLGMLYSTVSGGLIMLAVSVLLAIFTFGFSVFITQPICMVWGAIAADNENKKSLISAQTISRNY